MASGYRIAIIPDPLGRTCGRQRPGGLRRLMGLSACGVSAGLHLNTSGGRFAPAVSWHPAGFAAGIVPADSNRRMPRVRGVSWLVFGVKGLFPPKPPFISSLFRRGRSLPTGGWGRPSGPPCPPLVGVGHAWRVWVHTRHRKVRSRPSTVEPRHRRPGRHPASAGSAVARPPAAGPRIRCGAVRFPSWETGPHRFIFSIVHYCIL